MPQLLMLAALTHDSRLTTLMTYFNNIREITNF
jgi:hypothetical protein